MLPGNATTALSSIGNEHDVFGNCEYECVDGTESAPSLSLI